MSPLPWLLDWPPSRGTIAVFVLLTAFSVGTLVAFGGVTDEMTSEEASVESAEFTVRLNDEIQLPDTGEDGVQTCLASGTPGDRISVVGEVTTVVPSGVVRENDVVVEVSLGHTNETMTTAVGRSGEATHDVFWLLEDDETLSVGETADVQVRILASDSVAATATRSVTVEEGTRTYDC
jgi:hypothetical protein